MSHAVRNAAIATAVVFFNVASHSSWAQGNAPKAVGAPPFSAKAAASQPTKPAADPLKGLASEYDKMRGIRWYRHPSSPKNSSSNALFLYFGKTDSGELMPLRLFVRYSNEDWLFVKRAWAKADGIRVDIPDKPSKALGWDRDQANGGIYEWSDTSVTTPSEISTVKLLARAKDVTVRFEGDKYYDDRNLSQQQLKALRDVIAAYEAVTGKPWQ